MKALKADKQEIPKKIEYTIVTSVDVEMPNKLIRRYPNAIRQRVMQYDNAINSTRTQP